MNIILTMHAFAQMNERKILYTWVLETVLRPDVLIKSGFKFKAQKRLKGFALEVVYVKERNIKVITVYWV